MGDEGQGLLQLSQSPGYTELLMGKALLPNTGHRETYTTSATQRPPRKLHVQLSLWTKIAWLSPDLFLSPYLSLSLS